MFIATFLSAVPAEALKRLSDHSQYSFERFGTKDGLSSAAASSILQSHDGTLWVGTHDGLNSFDGYNISRVDPSFEFIDAESKSLVNSAVRVPNSEYILFGYGDKLMRLDPINQRVKEIAQLDQEDIRSVLPVDDVIYIGTNKGAYVLSDSTNSSPTPIDGLSGTIVRRIKLLGDTVFIGTDQGLFCLRQNRLDIALRVSVRDIDFRNEEVIVAAQTDGVLVLDANGKIVKKYSHIGPNPLPGSETKSVLVDNEGNLWIGTNEGLQIHRADGTQEKIDHDSKDPGSLSHNHVSFIFEDAGSNIWIGTLGGLNKYSPRLARFPKIDVNSKIVGLASNSISSFHEDADGTIWVGTIDGLSKWKPNNNSFELYSAEQLGLDKNPIMALAVHENQLYVGSMRMGILVLDPLTGVSQHSYSTTAAPPFRIRSNAVAAILTNENEVLIGSYGGGVFPLNTENTNTTNSTIEFSEVLSQPIIDVESYGAAEIWIVNESDKVYGYLKEEGADQTWVANTQIKTMSEPAVVNPQSEDVWIGTLGGGLNRYDKSGNLIRTYTVKDGLPSNLVYSIEVDNQGDIWTAGNKGLSRLDLDTGKIQIFTTSHGLQGDDFNGNTSLKLADGTLLFGGNNGFNAFDPAKIKLNDYKGQTLVTSFSKLNEKQPGRYRSDGSETIELNHEENVFSFSFALMDFASPKDNTFEYQLVGFDQDWVKAGKRNSVSYTNIDAGDYVFKVRGFNNDGLPTDKLGSVNLTITPPPWLTWWAYTIYFILAAAILGFAFRLNTQRVIRITNERRNQEERERLEHLVALRTDELNEKIKEQARTLHQKELANKEIHHRVKNNLQVILGLLTLQAETEENELFQSAMTEIRQRITSMSLIHKSLYEHSVATIDIQQYAENLVGSIRQFHPDVANGNIEVMLDVGKETMDIDAALPVGLILNELITNCLKHGFSDINPGGALNVIQISFKQDSGNYIMSVSDNGKGLPEGFDVDSPQSMGSELVLIFAQQLEGKITAENRQTGGAAFTLIFPAKVNKEQLTES